MSMASLNDIKKNKKSTSDFSLTELEFLLELIAESEFKGNKVQIVYETAVKLQNKIQDKQKS